MKNFQLYYPINGTSALISELSPEQGGDGIIIDFPSVSFSSKSIGISQQATPHLNDTRNQFPSFSLIFKRLRETEMARSLYSGDMRGKSFNRIKPWQSVTAGAVFTSIAFLSLFFGL